MSQVKAIIGLGNPGPKYDNTRHNAGAWVIEAVAKHHNVPLRLEKKFQALYARLSLAGEDRYLLFPQTYMNRSGASVAAFCQFFKLSPPELLVAHDELDLLPGTARYKHGGGHGGHNGLRDIASALGNDKSFSRIRVGIGHPGDSSQVTQYVLGNPGKAERAAIDAVLEEILATLPLTLEGEWSKAMNRLHSFSASK
ncbi:aminoacyl-tRNA hydrolase [Aidingimonas halophila]|uniref:Peptidyl-tRNA hydrolase n=1 Tax=Aidingimonas halophila TaxID=574349 RepID=A0A1H2R5B5_9GAMM|nr:aminoacyl-tRNA hydrolase [Aidingimonas halophila]GHC19809.1 peptidyl-tRNA hydrolase [Aidingimonas halophila]SDW14587.1 peptidyl-tRNA hydrolase [Aidingimonas halophila]